MPQYVEKAALEDEVLSDMEEVFRADFFGSCFLCFDKAEGEIAPCGNAQDAQNDTQ